MKNSIPYLLILFRFLCAPTILLLGYYLRQEASFWIVMLIYLGFLSDILDGIFARKMGIADSKIRRLDSQTDLIFWIAIGISSYLVSPTIITSLKIPVIILFITEGLCYLTSFIRFQKETCTHAWLSKLFGLSMVAAFTSIIGFHSGGTVVIFTFVLGYLSHLDRILITLIIPTWTHDIPSTYHATLLRKGKTFKRYKFLN